MFKRFYPDEMVDKVTDIDFQGMYDNGYRGVIFDIDNTLVEHGMPATEANKKFFAELKEIGLKVMFLSNNKEPRVKSFRYAVNYGDYIYKAGKPNPANYFEAMKRMGTDEDNTFFAGDQLFTDVWGGKKAGIKTFLVKPIDKKEEIQIVLKRILEKPVLWFYKRSKRKNNKK